MSPKPVASAFSRVRAPLTFLFLFGLVFFLLDRVVSLAFTKVTLASKQRFSRVYAGNVEAAVLVMGHSRGMGLVSTQALAEKPGLEVFNVSYNGMSTAIAEALFGDFLARNRAPQCVLVEVSSICSNNGLIRDMKPYTGRSGALRQLLLEEDPAISTASRLFHTYRFNGDLFPRIAYHLKRDDQFLTNHHRVTLEFLDGETLDPEEWKVRSGNVEALRHMAQRARAAGVEVRLVLGPFWPHFVENSPVPDRIADVASEVTGLEVWDFSRALSDRVCFADHVHLNSTGTLQLHELMVEAGLFRDFGNDTKPQRTDD